jgi:hypothetical protein
MNISLDSTRSAVDITFDCAKQVIKCPISVGCNYSCINFDKLNANQKNNLDVFRSNIKELSFENLRELLKRMHELYEHKSENEMDSPEWYVYNTIIQRMQFLEPTQIPVFKNTDDFTIVDFITVDKVAESSE